MLGEVPLPLVVDDPTPSAPAPSEPQVEIRPSARRRKTVEAHWEGDTIVVAVPQRLSRRARQACAEELAAKLVAARAAARPSDEELLARATALSARYLDGAAVPASVTWSSRQRRRWGSCTPADRTIRVSDALREVPAWVLDAVLLHELAHLLRPGHDAGFEALVARYPRHAEAEAFLAGYQHGLQRAGGLER